jgi:hypothetical protein
LENLFLFALVTSEFLPVLLSRFLYKITIKICTVRDTEFRASFFCHFKKLRCKSLYCQRDIQKSILKFIFCSRQSHVNLIVANDRIEVNNVAYFTFFYGILTVMPEIQCLELYNSGHGIFAVTCHSIGEMQRGPCVVVTSFSVIIVQDLSF